MRRHINSSYNSRVYKNATGAYYLAIAWRLWWLNFVRRFLSRKRNVRKRFKCMLECCGESHSWATWICAIWTSRSFPMTYKLGCSWTYQYNWTYENFANCSGEQERRRVLVLRTWSSTLHIDISRQKIVPQVLERLRMCAVDKLGLRFGELCVHEWNCAWSETSGVNKSY